MTVLCAKGPYLRGGAFFFVVLVDIIADYETTLSICYIPCSGNYFVF